MSELDEHLLLIQAEKFLGTSRSAILSLAAAGKVKVFVLAPESVSNYLTFPTRQKLFQVPATLIFEAQSRFSEEFFFDPRAVSPFMGASARRYNFDDLQFSVLELEKIKYFTKEEEKNKRTQGQEARTEKRHQKIIRVTKKFLNSTEGRKKREDFWSDGKLNATQLADQIFINRYKLELLKDGEDKHGYGKDAIYKCLLLKKEDLISFFNTEENKIS